VEQPTLKSYRLTIVACVVSVCITATANNLMPILFVPLMELYDFTFSKLGLLVAVYFIAELVAALSCAGLPDKIGFRPLLLAASGLTAIGFLLFFLTPFLFTDDILPGLILTVALYGLSVGLLDMLVSPVIQSLPFKNKHKAMSIFHSTFAGGIMISIAVTSLAIYYLPAHNWNFIPLFWVIMPLACVILWIKAPLIRPSAGVTHIPEVRPNKDDDNYYALYNDVTHKPEVIPTHKNAIGILSNKGVRNLLVMSLLAMFFGVASEMVVTTGASTFIEKGLAVPKLLGDIIGPCMFAVTFGIGRLSYGLFFSKWDIRTFMIGGSLACILLYLAAAFVPATAVSIIALALCGFATCLLSPGTYTTSSERFPDAGVWLFAVLNAIGKAGGAAASALFGILGEMFDGLASWSFMEGMGLTAEQLALRLSLAVCAVFPLMSLILQIVLKKKKVTV